MPDDGVTGGSQTAFSLAGKVPSTCAEFRAEPDAAVAAGVPQFDELLDAAVHSSTTACRSRRVRCSRTSSRRYAGTGGNADYTFDQSSLGSQILRIDYQEQNTDIKQARIDGKFKFEGGSTFGFGVETRSMESQPACLGSNLTMGDWGVGDAGNVPDMVALLTPFSLTGAFDDFNPVGAPDWWLEGQCERRSGQWALDHGYTNWTEASAPDGVLRYNPGFNTEQLCAGRHRRPCTRRSP